MAAHGKAGKVKVGTNTVADIDTWSLDIDRDTKESTAFGDSALPYRSFVAGLAGASGKLEGRLNMADTNGQLALWQSLTSDTALTLHLQTDSTTPHEFQVSAFITKMSPKVGVDALETVGFDFKVTGAPTFS